MEAYLEYYSFLNHFNNEIFKKEEITKPIGYSCESISNLHSFHYIPITNSLKFLLKNEEEMSEVMGGHSFNSKYMFDICDGKNCKNNPVVIEES